MNRLDIRGSKPVVAERLAQDANGLEQRGFGHERVLPDGIHQRLLRDYLPRLRRQRRQHGKRTRRQRHFVAAAPQTVAGLEAERTELHRAAELIVVCGGHSSDFLPQTFRT
jgi:hypothetical protein